MFLLTLLETYALNSSPVSKTERVVVAPNAYDTGDMPPPPLLQWLGTRGTVSIEQQTINWSNCTAHHKSVHQND